MSVGMLTILHSLCRSFYAFSSWRRRLSAGGRGGSRAADVATRKSCEKRFLGGFGASRAIKGRSLCFFVSLLRSQGARADPSPRFAPPAAAANGFPTDVSLIHRGVQSASDLVPDPLLHFGEKK